MHPDDRPAGHVHYLDDFVVFGAPSTAECKDRVLQLCRHLGIPIAAHKTEGPAMIIIFLGIELGIFLGIELGIFLGIELGIFLGIELGS